MNFDAESFKQSSHIHTFTLTFSRYLFEESIKRNWISSQSNQYCRPNCSIEGLMPKGESTEIDTEENHQAPPRDNESWKTLRMSPQNYWRLSAKRRQEDGWLSSASDSALPPRDGNGDGQPGLSLPDGDTLAFALGASDKSRALSEAALSASLWYERDPFRLSASPFLRSLCALVINRDCILRQG